MNDAEATKLAKKITSACIECMQVGKVSYSDIYKMVYAILRDSSD